MKPRKRKTQPKGEFHINKLDPGYDFVQARRWMWQWWPEEQRWVAMWQTLQSGGDWRRSNAHAE